MSCDFVCFFFFKQKTAYELRISDWSSDVCSSDLPDLGRDLAQGQRAQGLGAELQEPRLLPDQALHHLEQGFAALGEVLEQPARLLQAAAQVAGVAGAGVLDHLLVAAMDGQPRQALVGQRHRSEEHTAELQSLMRISS